MRVLLKLILSLAAGWLVLSACAPAATTTPVPTSLPGSGSSGGLTASPTLESYEGLYPPQDLSLVANTGRPQFLDSYADW